MKPQLHGVVIDENDGHKRITQSESFAVHGGSSEHHDRCVEVFLRAEEKLKKQGKSFSDSENERVLDCLNEANEHVSK